MTWQGASPISETAYVMTWPIYVYSTDYFYVFHFNGIQEQKIDGLKSANSGTMCTTNVSNVEQ